MVQKGDGYEDGCSPCRINDKCCEKARCLEDRRKNRYGYGDYDGYDYDGYGYGGYGGYGKGYGCGIGKECCYYPLDNCCGYGGYGYGGCGYGGYGGYGYGGCGYGGYDGCCDGYGYGGGGYGGCGYGGYGGLRHKRFYDGLHFYGRFGKRLCGNDDYRYWEVAETCRGFPGTPAAKLAKDLGYNVARRTGQQYADKLRSTGAYGSYT